MQSNNCIFHLKQTLRDPQEGIRCSLTGKGAQVGLKTWENLKITVGRPPAAAPQQAAPRHLILGCRAFLLPPAVARRQTLTHAGPRLPGRRDRGGARGRHPIGRPGVVRPAHLGAGLQVVLLDRTTHAPGRPRQCFRVLVSWPGAATMRRAGRDTSPDSLWGPRVATDGFGLCSQARIQEIQAL